MNCEICYKKIKNGNYTSVGKYKFIHKECVDKIPKEVDKHFKLSFDDGSSCSWLEYNGHNEEEVLKQMNKPKSKRGYVFGIQFDRVQEVSVI